MPLLLLVLLAAVLLTSVAPGECDAQTRGAGPSQEPAGYREAIDTALEEVQLGNFAEARAQFTRAHALFPNARTLRGLGIAEFELKHYLPATNYLTQALASEIRPLDGSLRRETEGLLTRAKTYVGELRILVSPAKASLLIDGTLKVDVIGRPVQLDVGDHVLEFHAQGYASERRQITVQGGQAERIEVQLAALATAATAQAEPASPATAPAGEVSRSERVPVYKRWWLWTIVGAVAAGAAAGIVVALKANKAPVEYQSVPSDNTPTGAALRPLWKY